MRLSLLLLPLLLSACAGTMVPPCDFEGDRPLLTLSSDAWPDGAVGVDDDGEERIDLSVEVTVTGVDDGDPWTATLTDEDGAELLLSASSEAGTVLPEVGVELDVRYSRWHVGEVGNQDDSFLRVTRIGGGLFAWAASDTSVEGLDLPEGLFAESGQEICRSSEEDGTSWHSSLRIGSSHESMAEIDPGASVRTDDWDVTNDLNRRTHYPTGDQGDTWAVGVVGFLFE
jgi:hypothetical protein